MTVLNLLRVATHFDHLCHPFDGMEGLDECSLTKRVAGVALFVFVSILTLGLGGTFYFYHAMKKIGLPEDPPVLRRQNAQIFSKP